MELPEIKCSMNLLNEKVNKFVDLDQSADYKRAKKIVMDHTNQLQELKKLYQEKGITAHMTREGDIVRRLEFKVSTFRRVDAKRLPESIRNEYTVESPMWTCVVCKFSMEEND